MKRLTRLVFSVLLVLMLDQPPGGAPTRSVHAPPPDRIRQPRFSRRKTSRSAALSNPICKPTLLSRP